MGHEIGSHSLEHFNLTSLTQEQVWLDLEKSFKILSEKCGDVKHFAFPYGSYKFFNDTVRTSCFNVGYSSLATAERGCHINHPSNLQPNELCISRDHVVLNWKIEHILVFLVRNARRATSTNNLYPFEFK